MWLSLSTGKETRVCIKGQQRQKAPFTTDSTYWIKPSSFFLSFFNQYRSAPSLFRTSSKGNNLDHSQGLLTPRVASVISKTLQTTTKWGDTVAHLKVVKVINLKQQSLHNGVTLLAIVIRKLSAQSFWWWHNCSFTVLYYWLALSSTSWVFSPPPPPSRFFRHNTVSIKQV